MSMGRRIVISTYFIFFLSGAAALMYEIVWARQLGLIFGGSHLAVTSVLFVFMAGLALGSYLIGRRIDASRRLLGLFGFLELGVGWRRFSSPGWCASIRRSMSSSPGSLPSPAFT